MGMHTLNDLKLKWLGEDVTAEQMVGQLLQHLEVLYERLRLLEKAYHAERRVQAQPTTQQAKRPSKL
jgi:hypothetical protein